MAIIFNNTADLTNVTIPPVVVGTPKVIQFVKGESVNIFRDGVKVYELTTPLEKYIADAEGEYTFVIPERCNKRPTIIDCSVISDPTLEALSQIAANTGGGTINTGDIMVDVTPVTSVVVCDTTTNTEHVITTSYDPDGTNPVVQSDIDTGVACNADQGPCQIVDFYRENEIDNVLISEVYLNVSPATGAPSDVVTAGSFLDSFDFSNPNTVGTTPGLNLNDASNSAAASDIIRIRGYVDVSQDTYCLLYTSPSPRDS